MLKILNIRQKTGLKFIIAYILFIVIGVTNGMLMRSTSEYFRELKMDKSLNYSLEVSASFNMTRRNYLATMIFAEDGTDVTGENFAAFMRSLGQTLNYLDRSLEAMKDNHFYSPEDAEIQIQNLRHIINFMTNDYQRNAQNMYRAILSDELDRALDLAYTGTSMADNIADWINEFITFKQANINVRFDQAIQKTLNYSMFFILQTFLVILILILLRRYINNNIKKPFVKLLEDVNDISKGKLDKNLNSVVKDEIGILYTHIGSIVSTLQSLVDDMKSVNYNIKSANGSIYIREEKYMGTFREIATTINETCVSLSNETEDIVKTVQEYNKGNFAIKVRRFNGDKADIHESIDELRSQLKLVNKEVTYMIQSIIAGSLDSRVTVESYNGDWQNIMTGLNYMIENIEKPTREFDEVLESLANGNTSARVRGNYFGKFERMKYAINKIAESMDSSQSDI